MAENIHRKPIPIPTYEDYSTGAMMLEQEFQQEGGAWVAFQRESILEAQTKPSVYRLHHAMGSVARLLEPVSEETLAPDDPYFRATHAFRAGMWTGRRLMGQVYNETSCMDYTAAHLALSGSLPHSWYTSYDQFEENRDALITTGHGGLDLLGSDAREYIDRFSEDIIDNERYRKEYRLGTGAIMFAAHGLYKVAYNKIRVSYEAAQLFDADELDAFLADAANSGEIE